MNVGVDEPFNLERFLAAQDGVFDAANAELRAGVKQGHWIWFIFPQLAGLGRSSTAEYYAIASLDEASAYLAHPVLGSRLRQCAESLIPWAGKRSAEEILGPIDALKLRSSLTLFDQIEPGCVFGQVLREFYAGIGDERTLAILNARA
jgi:uncharacterized protein (DUF1810 family)